MARIFEPVVCVYCETEIDTDPFWIGPKRLRLCYCNAECYIKNFAEKYPDVFPQITKKYMEEQDGD